MAEEPTAVPAEEPSSSSEPAQPAESPSPPEAAPVAAVPVSPTEEPAEEPVDWQKRLSRQQSVLAQQADVAKERARAEQDRADALQAQLDAQLRKDMTAEQRVEFDGKRAQEALAAERQTLEDEREAVQGHGNYLQWYSMFLARGVPAERIKDCKDYAEMEQAAWAYQEERIGQSQGVAPAAPPPIVPGDQVQAGGVGAPPSREYDKAKGFGAGSKEWRAYVKKQARSGSKELI